LQHGPPLLPRGGITNAEADECRAHRVMAPGEIAD
jgi:hypothetical protein